MIDPSTRRPRAGWALCAILAAGVAFRLYSYIANPSLSVDDAMLALNLGTRSFPDLLRPLALDQAAPPLFLWALKALTLLGGMRDPLLRLLPVIAGCAVPYLTWRVGRRLLTAGGALLAAALAACSPILIQYSVSAKPYETDAAAALVLAGLTLDLIDGSSREVRPGALWKLAAAGALALLASTPSIFVLAACVVTLLALRPVFRSAPAGLLGMMALWSVTFAAVYFGLARHEAASPYLQRFWSARMLGGGPFDPARVWDVIKRVPMEAFLPFRKTSEPEVLSWLVVVAGAWILARRQGVRAILIAGPLVVTLGASCLALYPIAARLALFAAPAICLMLAAALEYPSAQGWTGWPVIASRAVSVLATVLLITAALPTGWWPPNTRSQVAAFAGHRTPGENVYLFSGVVPDWTRYATNWRDPDHSALERVLELERTDGTAFHNALGRGRAVSDTEGAELIVPRGDHLELLGLAPGIQFREGQMFSQPHPDSLWAEREAARISAAARPTIWVALAYSYQGEDRDLLAAVERAGGERIATLGGRGAPIYQYRFAPR